MNIRLKLQRHDDAVDISVTTLNGLLNFKNSTFIISTHLHEIKSFLNEVDFSYYYLKAELANRVPVFTYSLQRGWSDLRIGKILFEQGGIKELLRKHNREDS